jgi:hypothetical protein
MLSIVSSERQGWLARAATLAWSARPTWARQEDPLPAGSGGSSSMRCATAAVIGVLSTRSLPTA